MKKNNGRRYGAVVIGVSTGGVSALKIVLGALGEKFPVPVLVTTHIAPDSDDGLAILLNTYCNIHVKEADEREELIPGIVYMAPANYHLLVERDYHLSLSIDAPVSYARPSVDVLFESAAGAYGPALIGVILTGAGSDGSNGLKKIKHCGGLAIVQDPADAEMDSMPKSALQVCDVDHVLPLKEIPQLLLRFVKEQL